MLLAGLALTLTLAHSHAAEQYAKMRELTFERGRALELVWRIMVPAPLKRVDECVLIAAPKDQDWEGEYVYPDGLRTGLKVGFDDDGDIQFLYYRARVDLPDDPHVGEKPVHIALPVTDRPLVPFSGGPTKMWNQHVFNPDQRHAVDLVGWRNGGSHSDNEGEHDEDYVIWDAPVRSPVDGVIVSVENDADDHLKPMHEMTDDQHPFGNVVMIRIEGTDPELYVVLGHMRKGSVVVTAGMEVKVGDPIGRVGNSGNSSEPHLHVHVQDGPVIKQGYSVPFVINDKPVLRGVLIDVHY